jgi:FtsH-binding integral membrane protein
MRNAWAAPVADAAPAARSAFLQKVGALTFTGLATAGAAALTTSLAILAIPALQGRWVSLAVLFGSWFGAQFVGRAGVRQPSRVAQLAGFYAGSGLQGVAMGYLLLMAAGASAQIFGNPFVIVAQAVGLTGLSALGMLIYLGSGPKELSLVRGGIALLSLPMLAVMLLTLVFPVGGFFGMLLSVGFVVISAGGLLHALNEVIHRFPTHAWVAASFEVTLGVLALFWNLVVLLSRAQRR